jgi:hypothetical protein
VKFRLLSTLTLGSLLLILPAGAVSSPSQTKASSKYEAEKALPTVPVTAESWKQQALQDAAWHRARLRAAYERAGTKNPKWNEPMLALLDQVANLRGGADLADPEQVEKLVREIRKLGCTDPLFQYFVLRYGNPAMKQEDVIPAFRAASQALMDSDYDALEKFWAMYRTASQIKSELGPKGTPEFAPLRRTAVELLAQAFANPELPVGEVVNTSEDLLIFLKPNPPEYRAAWDRLTPLMTNHWSQNPRVLLTLGWGHADRAWMARGTGFADSVTDDGWKAFAAELAQAEACLTNSWARGALNRTANQMMRVELGQGEGRKRLELWFERAMELNPRDYDSCADKLWYLMPRWHGDHEEMLEFGRSCLTHPRWKGQVPLALMRAHELIASDFPKEKRPAYWRTKAVWSDVQKSFDRFFELNPKNVSWRHNFAKYAWRAGDWDELNRQIPLLGEINYSYFGGKEQFDRMLSEAKARDGTGPK